MLSQRYHEYPKLYAEGATVVELAARAGVTGPCMFRILKRRGGPDGVRPNGYVGGTRITKQGYVVKNADFPGDDSGLLHRLIAKKALGRKLKPNEVVHHINQNRSDARPANLLICTARYHRELHARMARMGWSASTTKE
jgi:hypothetical protein